MPFKLEMTAEAQDQISGIMTEKSKPGLQKQLKKVLGFLSQDPRYPSLNSHLLENSEAFLGLKVWTSYVQNKTPQAHRILWSYGEEKDTIVILAVVPHY